AGQPLVARVAQRVGPADDPTSVCSRRGGHRVTPSHPGRPRGGVSVLCPSWRTPVPTDTGTAHSRAPTHGRGAAVRWRRPLGGVTVGVGARLRPFCPFGRTTRRPAGS